MSTANSFNAKEPLIVWYGLEELFKEVENNNSLIKAYYEILVEKIAFKKDFEEYIDTTISAVWYQMLMGISRMFDPKTTCGQDNCSFKMLKSVYLQDDKRFPNGENEQPIKRINGLVEQYNSSLISHYRNKRMAHNDLTAIFSNTTLPSYIDIDKLIQEMTDVVDDFLHIYFGAAHTMASNQSIDSKKEYYKKILLTMTE